MRLNTLLFSVFFALAAYGQKATISGYIEDAGTGEKLIGASVFDSEKLAGTTSNVYGFFSLTLDTGRVHLQVSYVGYTAHKQIVDLRDDKSLTISLVADQELDEVVVAAESIERIHDRSQMSAMKLPIKQVEKLPAFMGERDVIKTIQLMPGIQSGSEGSSGLYVRGGGPDQNLILLDGVPVYNATHLFGFFSVFNSDAINNVEIIKGGFPARYGGRVSSVLDIRMKEGNTKKLKGSASIGLIASKLTLEAPLVKDKTSFILSARRTYIDVLTWPAQAMMNAGNSEGKSRSGYFFHDINAKVNHKFNNRHRLYLSSYMGKDKVYMKFNNSYEGVKETFDTGLDWGNITTALRYNYMVNNKLFSNFTGTYSRYRFNVGFKSDSENNYSGKKEQSNYSYNYISGIYDWGAKLDFDYLPSPNHFVRFGANETFHTFTPGVNAFKSTSGDYAMDTTFGSSKIYAHEVSAFVEDDIKVGKRLKVNPGLHYSMFFVKGTQYQNLQPRLSANYLLVENVSVKASYSQMAQYLHLLTNGTIGLPTDLWVPVTDSVPPITATQYAAGFAYTFKKDYEFSAEAYYKEMDKLIEYKDGATFYGNAENWEEKIEIGTGDSYGVELFVQKKRGKTSGWIGYTLSWTQRHFDNLNYGRTFPYKYDRRHDVSLAVLHEFDKRSERVKWKKDIGLTWVYGTGNAISLPTSVYRQYDCNYLGGNSMYSDPEWGSDIENYEERNGFREPAYHRMDLSFTFTSTAGRFEKSWNISIYNVYNRKNPFYIYFEQVSENERVLKQLSIFPIIPTVSYSLKF